MNTHRQLYKRDTGGKIRVWWMQSEGAKHRTIAGLQDGNPATSDWTTCVGKQKRSDEEQAQFEVNSAYTNKLDREYFETVAEVDTPRFFKPMLAHKYDAIKAWPVYSQPKLDGIRAIATKDGLKSREGQPILSCPHIERALAPFFHSFPTAVLDGELYNHDLKDDFNEIVSIVKREKCSDDDLERSAALAQYHIYDYPRSAQGPDWGFADRHEALHIDLAGMPHCIQLVLTNYVSDQARLDSLYAEYIGLGYEGQMVRLDKPYEQKRSKTLLKRKEFLDGEFELVSIEEGLGNWSGVAKKITCRMENGATFGAGIKGNKARAAELLNETWEKVTVRYFALTPDGIPRFPVATHFYNGVRL